MYEASQDARWVHSIDLAREADFGLGSLRVRPGRCEVEWNGNSQILQRRVMQVLVALAQARGSVVSQNDLVIRCWRGLSVTDDAIVRCISKLRKLATAYPGPPFAIETIPGVGYRLSSSSFVDDVAPIETAARHKRHFHLGALAAAAAFAILAFIGAAVWLGRGHNQPSSTRVAVQPFEALSDSANVRSLARRIPNEVVDALGDSQIQAVLGGKDDAGAASPAPGLIVTGILRDDGPSTIVDVRVEDGPTQAALWSTEFKRDSRQSSDLPAEVAARVADIVNMVAFARSANPPLSQNSALSALLQTTDMIRASKDSDWAQMIERAQSIVTRNPEFAFGHSVLAAAYADAAENINIPERTRAMSDAARREAILTLKLDPQDAGAYAVLAGLEYARRPYNYYATETILLRGLKNAKHPKEPLGALYQYEGNLLASVGRLREGLSLQLVAQATDQWSPAKMSRLALVYANIGNILTAKEALQKAVQRWPNHSFVRMAQQYIAGFYEQPSEALATINRLDAQTPSDQDANAIWRAFIQARSSHSGPVTSVAIRNIREAADRGQIPRDVEIMMLAALGESQQAFDAANSALDHQQLDSRFLFAPVTRNLRQDPGFVRLATRMGLVEYWRETGKRPDFCTDPATRSECGPQLLAAINARSS